MLISMQDIIPECNPCIIEANTIKMIYVHSEESKAGTYKTLAINQYDNNTPIHLMELGYRSDEILTKEVMNKAAFAIQAAKTEQTKG